jgi:hypothetical protein
MRRIMLLVTVVLVMAAMMLAMAMPAFAAPREENFGHCASDEAREGPPGPAHGEYMSYASINNPHGVNVQCPKEFTANR